MKKVINAVRTFVIVDRRVLCIEYKEENVWYIDIPGGKIENGETSINVVIEYPDKIYNMNVFVASNYKENDALFIDIEDLLKEKKRYAITYLLDNDFKGDFNNRKVNVNFNVDDNHRVINYYKM